MSRETPTATALVIGSPKIKRPANAALQSIVLWVMGTVNNKTAKGQRDLEGGVAGHVVYDPDANRGSARTGAAGAGRREPGRGGRMAGLP